MYMYRTACAQNCIDLCSDLYSHFQCELGVTRVDPMEGNIPGLLGPGMPKFLATALLIVGKVV